MLTSLAISVTADVAKPDYSVCTLVSDMAQYDSMLATFADAGFDQGSCEFLYVDNTGGNTFDAYAGLNRLLSRSSGRHVILCHQDIVLPGNSRANLDRRIAEMDVLDPAWGVLGCAGHIANGKLAVRITDPKKMDATSEDALVPVPIRCMSLDEAFMLVKREANLSFSRDLSGFHLYGADICLIADLLGWTSWVVDFPIHHLSAGTTNSIFAAARTAMIAKWQKAFRPRVLGTTCTLMPITSSPVLSVVGRSTKGLSLWRRLLGNGMFAKQAVREGCKPEKTYAAALQSFRDFDEDAGMLFRKAGRQRSGDAAT